MQETIYLEPIGSYTNQAFADFPLDEALITEVRLKGGEEPIRVWEVTEEQLRQVVASKANSCLEFKIYKKSEKDSFAREIHPERRKMAMIRASRRVSLVIKGRTRKSA